MFSTFLCNSLCSALTTSLVGVAKAIFQTVIGYFTFGGVPYHPLNVAGLFLNLCGGFLYTKAKYKEKKHEDNLDTKKKSTEENNVVP